MREKHSGGCGLPPVDRGRGGGLFRPSLPAFLANLLRLDLPQDVIMSATLDEVFQVDLTIFILQVKAPAGNLVDVRPVDWLPIADGSVQTRLGKLARRRAG